MTTARRRSGIVVPVHQPPPNPKYRARKTKIDGIDFASAMEGAFYEHLKQLKAAGDVERIVLQPSFVLQAGFEKHGRKYRAITYVADFGVVYSDGRRVVYDVKGAETPVWKLKQKLYARLYDEPLVAVRRVRGEWIEV